MSIAEYTRIILFRERGFHATTRSSTLNSSQTNLSRSELRRLKDLADRGYDWNDAKGAAAYNDALQAKVAR